MTGLQSSSRPRGTATHRRTALGSHRSRKAPLLAVAVLTALTAACTSGAPISVSPAGAAHDLTATSAANDDFSSSSSATGRVGSALSFQIDTADEDARITESGALPPGVTFRSQVGAGAILTGSPAVGSGGVYHLALSASGPAGRASQSLTLTIDEAPTFVGSVHIVTWALKYNHTPIATTGYPPAAITESGTLPSGMVFKDNGDGTAQLDGNPTLFGDTGASSIMVTAQNSLGQTAESIGVTAVNGSSVVNLVFDLIP